jgi:predicted O-methyltransferase YrrM
LQLAFGALATFNFLMLRLLLKNPARAQTFPGRIFREYMSLVGKDRWQSKDIFDIVPIKEGTRVTLEHLPGKGIGTPVDELAYLALLAAAAQPEKIFEIGTYRGRTALNFALNSPPGCKVYTLDLSPEQKMALVRQTHPTDVVMIQDSTPEAEYRGKDVAHKIEQLYGDCMVFDFSPYYGQIDLVFVDGAHDYEAVKSDTLNALRMCRPGGLVVWHDFANYGDYHDVTRAILDVLPAEKVIQVANTQLAVYRNEGEAGRL